MKHYDEHTIELFALGSDKVAFERSEFLNHIDECYSCREMYEEMAQFYKLANGDQRQLHEHVENADSTSLAIKPEYRYVRPVVPVPRSIPARAWQYARRRPVVSSFSGIGIAALITLVLNTTVPKKDNNPAYVVPNDSLGKISVFNKNDEKLWDLPGRYFFNLREYEGLGSVSQTQVADFDLDGSNEIATVVRFGKLTPLISPVLRIYRADQQLTFNSLMEIKLQYGGKLYEMSFVARFLLPFNTGPGVPTDLLIGYCHTNSPSVIQRVNGKGEIIGEYAHIGHFASGYMMHIAGIDHKVCVLSGIDDIQGQGVITILDPARLAGKSESPATPGFGYRKSDAEIYSVLIPLTDFERAGGTRGGIRFLSEETADRIKFTYYTSNLHVGIETVPMYYEFSKTLEIQNIHLSDGVKILHKYYRDKGKISSTLDHRYIENLKKQIKYWNGRQWGDKPVRLDSLQNPLVKR